MFLYRSQGLNTASLLIELEKLIDTKRPTLIVGDINLCFKANHNNRLVQGLLKIGFQQLVQEPTHIQGRLIDHAYSFDPQKKLKIYLERYSPYYSDHDGLCLTVKNTTEKQLSKLDVEW